MSEIRADVGGSKSTLWTYFSCKDELFVAVISQASQRITDEIVHMATNKKDPSSSLERFCYDYIARITSDDAITLHRLVIGEARRFPEIGQTFFADVIEAIHRAIAEYLTRIFPENAAIAQDPAGAAELLASLCHGRCFLRRIYGSTIPPGPMEIEADSGFAVMTFLRAFGSKP